MHGTQHARTQRILAELTTVVWFLSPFCQCQGFSNYENWWFTGVKEPENPYASRLGDGEDGEIDVDFVQSHRSFRNSRRRNPPPDPSTRVNPKWYKASTMRDAPAEPLQSPLAKRRAKTAASKTRARAAKRAPSAEQGGATHRSQASVANKDGGGGDGQEGGTGEASNSPPAAGDPAPPTPMKLPPTLNTSPGSVRSTPRRNRSAMGGVRASATAPAGRVGELRRSKSTGPPSRQPDGPPLLARSLWSPLNDYASTTTMHAGRSSKKGAHHNPWARNFDARPLRYVAAPVLCQVCARRRGWRDCGQRVD